ncbi:L,D-transpeptidase family protein [Streptomyces sp. NPDC026672]|uniref:L,D-transpeptidase family protein n=1 Tax=unclassified Streptomyces TaxID=2593676 RepID=UPI0033C2599E
MRKGSSIRGVAAAACGAVLALSLVACGGSDHKPGKTNRGAVTGAQARKAELDRVPGIGDGLWKRVPADSRQVVAVYGAGRNSADSTVALFTRNGSTWTQERSWAAHNGRKGWTTDHHEGDKRTPVGVFTLSDAGGVLKPPATRLPYTESAGFQAPHSWSKGYWHDFDYVIAIDYNRVKGTSPNDPTRPEGQSKGGSIWLHMDHGSGTSACVSQSKADMEYLLRTLDPAQHPVVVMGDKADLKV